MQKAMHASDAITFVLVGNVRAGAARACAKRASLPGGGDAGCGIVDELKRLLAAIVARLAAPVDPSLALLPF
jgi:hypothetical protein